MSHVDDEPPQPGATGPFPDHRGQATWGERRVPLEAFREACRAHGRRLDPAERAAAVREHLATERDPTPREGPYERILVFGGVYNNRFGVEAVLDAADRHRAQAVFCLGDLGGFGPHPGEIRPLLEQAGVRCIQGNYEASLAAGLDDCNCGYTDPRDNRFAALSYDYTATRTSAEDRAWMGSLPSRRRVLLGDVELLLVHGSPRRINEFLFESTTPAPFLERLLEENACSGLLCTHTGLDWHRRLPSGRDVVNVGVIGRPANDGRTEVRYALLERRPDGPSVELRPLRYAHEALAAEMRREELPAEFVETILTGWWTTCLEILPARERARSRF